MPIEIRNTPMEKRSVWDAMWKGAKLTCPSCGKGKLYSRYLKVVNQCSHCGEELHHHRADDAPPYFTIFILGHLIVPLMIAVEKIYTPDLWIHAAIWLPLTISLSLALLPVVKGAIVGIQWAYHMHGFGGHDDLPVKDPSSDNRF